MKKLILLFGLIGVIIVIGACSNRDTEKIREVTEMPEEQKVTDMLSSNIEASEEQEVADMLSSNIETTVSGSFTVWVQDVIPDYSINSETPNIAIVAEFQSYPFTVFVGEEIGSQLEIGETYVFTIKPMVVGYTKEYLKGLNLSSLVWELPRMEITDFRLANEDEIGLESPTLRIE